MHPDDPVRINDFLIKNFFNFFRFVTVVIKDINDNEPKFPDDQVSMLLKLSSSSTFPEK
jgi:hypothetical protein